MNEFQSLLQLVVKHNGEFTVTHDRWNRHVNLRIVCHPGTSKAVSLDHCVVDVDVISCAVDIGSSVLGEMIWKIEEAYMDKDFENG